MDLWRITQGLGWDFGDFQDWTSQACKPGSPGRAAFEAWGRARRKAEEARQAFWRWALKAVDQGAAGPGFLEALKQREQKVAKLEQGALEALEGLLRAYREDREGREEDWAEDREGEA